MRLPDTVEALAHYTILGLTCIQLVLFSLLHFGSYSNQELTAFETLRERSVARAVGLLKWTVLQRMPRLEDLSRTANASWQPSRCFSS